MDRWKGDSQVAGSRLRAHPSLARPDGQTRLIDRRGRRVEITAFDLSIGPDTDYIRHQKPYVLYKMTGFNGFHRTYDAFLQYCTQFQG